MNIKNHKISVIVPVYNTARYIKTCVNSIINQSYKNIEIILVNDGSTDNSIEICNNLQKTDDRIKVISQNNNGAGSARNNGIKNATGDFISFVDSDDWIVPNAYETMLNIYNDNNDCCIYIKRKEIYRNLEKLSTHKYKGLVEANPNNIMNIDVSPCDKLFIAKNIKALNLTFPTGVVCEDHAFCWRYFTNYNKIYFSDEVLYNRVNRDDSASRFNKSPKGLDGLKIAKTIKENLIKDNLLKEYNIPFIDFVYSGIKLAIKKIDDANLCKIPEMAFELLEDIDISMFKNKKKLKLVKKAKNKELNLNFYRNKKKIEFFIKKITKLFSKKEYHKN